MPTKAQLEKEVAILEEKLRIEKLIVAIKQGRITDLEHRLNHAQNELQKLQAEHDRT